MIYDYVEYCELILCGSVAGAKEIDIAATLEHLRDQRPGMVQTKVRDCVKLCLKSSEEVLNDGHSVFRVSVKD